MSARDGDQGCDRVLTKTQPLAPARHPGWTAPLTPLELVNGEVDVPELVLTVTDVGVLIHGHHAKYQPFVTLAATVLPLAKLNLTAETLRPACPNAYGP
jgi:hypothetical protein